MCDYADINPWNGLYKAVLKRLRRAVQEIYPQLLKKIVATLFPGYQISGSGRIVVTKASDLDLIPKGALKLAVKPRCDLLPNNFESCLKEGLE